MVMTTSCPVGLARGRVGVVLAPECLHSAVDSGNGSEPVEPSGTDATGDWRSLACTHGFIGAGRTASVSRHRQDTGKLCSTYRWRRHPCSRWCWVQPGCRCHRRQRKRRSRWPRPCCHPRARHRHIGWLRSSLGRCPARRRRGGHRSTAPWAWCATALREAVGNQWTTGQACCQVGIAGQRIERAAPVSLSQSHRITPPTVRSHTVHTEAGRDVWQADFAGAFP